MPEAVKGEANLIAFPGNFASNSSLEVLSEVHPEYQGFTLKRVNYVTFDYISPVDGDWYSGKHKQARHEDGSWIREGDKLAILAHKTEPKKISKM